jgi:hypothetical protein
VAKLAEAYVDISVKMDQLNRGLTSSNARIEQFASRANSLLGAIGVGVGVAGAGRMIADLAQQGSNLSETMNKVQVVFGSASGVVNGMATQMADNFGMVKNVTLDAAANLGLVAQGAGMSANEAATLSNRLVRLAADASSFYNVRMEDALQKIRSGLVGEAEPLRAFGVMLSEAAVQQQALAMGLTTTNSKLSEHEKFLARVELISKGLSSAQGDLARTADGYANSIRRLAGEWENFKAEIGKPVAEGAAGGLSKVLSGITGIKGSSKEIGFLPTMLLTLASNFDSGAQKALTSYMTRGIAGDAMYDAIRDPDGRRMVDRLGANETDAQFRQRMLGMAIESAKKRQTSKSQQEFQLNGRNSGLPGGLFGAGVMPELPGIYEFEIAKRQRAMNKSAWGGGYGGMSALDFARAAQESINRPKDETAKAQLDELKKIHAALTRQNGARPGVVLRGPA